MPPTIPPNYVKRLADKYISDGGGEPVSEELQAITPKEKRASLDLILVGSFIAWHEDDALWGGVHKKEAWEALCRIIGLPAERFEQIIKDGA